MVNLEDGPFLSSCQSRSCPPNSLSPSLKSLLEAESKSPDPAHSIRGCHPSNLPISSSRNAPRKGMSQNGLVVRVMLFLLLEGAFIAIVAAATLRHIVLPISPNMLTETRAMTTLVTVVWHAVATFTVKDIALYVFSAEWMEQIKISGRIDLDNADLVSRILSGYIDQIKHFFSSTTTHAFRLGFVSVILLLAVNALGPSAISVDTVFLPHSTTIKVANLSITEPPSFFQYFGDNGVQLDAMVFEPGIAKQGKSVAAIERAVVPTRAEMFENTLYGFRSDEPNILIPWPDLSMMASNETIHYETDVVTYNFTCSWSQDFSYESSWKGWVWNVDHGRYLLQGGDMSWMLPQVVQAPYNMSFCGATILPLLSLKTAWDLSGETEHPSIGFLFLGDNQTDSKSLNRSFLFDHVPLTLAPTNLIQRSGVFKGWVEDCTGKSIGALVCHPQFEVVPAIVTISHGSLSLSELGTGSPVIKNVPSAAARTIFAYSLGSVAPGEHMPSWTISDGGVSDVAQDLFLAVVDGRLRTLPTSQISENMNKILQSSSKAYLGGFNGTDETTQHPMFSIMDTAAVGQSQRLVLNGSRPFLIALAILVGIVALLFICIVVIVRRARLHTFDLGHIIEVLGFVVDRPLLEKHE